MKRQSPIKQRLLVLAGILALLWGVEAVDWLSRGRLEAYGIRPREISGLWGILCAPFLHGNWDHLGANSVALVVLAWFVLLRGVREFFEVSLVILLLGGLGTWLMGSPHSVHIGASGVIFGYLGFLIVRGLIDFNLLSLLSGLLAGLLYGGLIWGLFRSRPGVSWAGHVSGLLAGMFMAWVRVRYGEQRRS